MGALFWNEKNKKTGFLTGLEIYELVSSVLRRELSVSIIAML